MSLRRVNTLRGRAQQEWRRLERHVFKDDPNYVPAGTRFTHKKGTKTFFLLRREGRLVGRCTATVDDVYRRLKGENVGFLDDFVVRQEHTDSASGLIDACVDHLRDQGVEKVTVRSCQFPALKLDSFDLLSSTGLPNNPEWYIDLFRGYGFQQERVWKSFKHRLEEVPPEELEEAYRWLDSQGIQFGLINPTDRKQMKALIDLQREVFLDHYGLHPGDPTANVDSPFASLGLVLLSRVSRVRMCGYWKEGTLVGFYTFMPEFSTVYKQLHQRGRSPISWLKFLQDIRRAKVVRIGVVGLHPSVRGNRMAERTDPCLDDLYLKEGYQATESGPILADNIAAIKWTTKEHNLRKRLSETTYGTYVLQVAGKAAAEKAQASAYGVTNELGSK